MGVEYLPQLISTLIFEGGSLIEPGTHWFSKTSWPVCSRELLVSTCPVLALQIDVTMPSFL